MALGIYPDIASNPKCFFLLTSCVSGSQVVEEDVCLSRYALHGKGAEIVIT